MSTKLKKKKTFLHKNTNREDMNGIIISLAELKTNFCPDVNIIWTTYQRILTL